LVALDRQVGAPNGTAASDQRLQRHMTHAE